MDRLSTTFAALSDPTRRAILSRLSSGDASVNELAEPFNISLPGISKHLTILERAGLITRSREAQWRPCSLNSEVLKNEVSYGKFIDWANLNEAIYNKPDFFEI